jgi:hypothetical protein
MDFKFFDDGWQQPPLEPIVSAGLENEMVIRYMNNERFVIYKTIAWARGIHAFADNWVQIEFEGTMEEFFTNRLEIPVILSIEALIPDGATFTEDDRDYLNYFNFDCPVKIIYYQYESI